MKKTLKYTLITLSLVLAMVCFNNNPVASGTLAIIAVASVPRAETLDRSGNATKYRVHLLHVDTEADVDNVPFADKEAQTMADIPRQAGKYWHYLDAIVNSVRPKFNTGEDGILVANEIEVKLGGLKKGTRRFLNNFKGEDFYIVWEVCAGSQAGKKFIAGTKCSGMKLTISEGGWLAESTGATIVFKNSCPDIPYEYLGNTPQIPPVSVPADATEINITNAGEYRLSDNSALTEVNAVTGLTAADHGRIVTLLSPSTGSNPTEIHNGGIFLLRDGAAFIANPGSKISLSVYKDGTSSFKLIEIEGSRV